MDRLYTAQTYHISDLKKWHDSKELNLEPKFQRRKVWKPKAQAYLIDTILRGLPMPSIYLRYSVDPKTNASQREVVDGQQRLTAIFSFIENGFKVLKIHNEEFGGMYYRDLPEDEKRRFLSYEIPTFQLLDPRDEMVLDIFARMNSYSLTLNPQEKINSKYYGAFKQFIYSLSRDLYQFWLDNGILSSSSIARMADAELVGELIIAMLDGTQSRSQLENYYKKYDDDFADADRLKKEFTEMIEMIKKIFEGDLKGSEFTMIPQFYSLFLALYGIKYGLKGTKFSKASIKQEHYAKIRSALQEIESIIQNKEEYRTAPEYAGYLLTFYGHTTTPAARKTKIEFVAGKILGKIK